MKTIENVRSLALVVVACLNVINLSFATTYYVAKTGTDSGSCSTKAPCLTIQRAVSRAVSPGDIVIVRAGTYIESVTDWNNGGEGQPILVKVNPGDSVIWRGSDADPDSLTGAISIQRRSYIRVEGFIFDGTVARATIRVRGRDRKHDPQSGQGVMGIEIINNTFTNNGNDGTATDGAGSVVIYFQGTGGGPSYSGPPTNVISKNTFSGNFGADIHLIAGTGDTRIADNVSTRLRSSRTASSGNFFKARFVHVGGESKRNVIERNTVSSISKDAYATEGRRYFASGIRLDAGARDNAFLDNMVHDIDFSGDGRSAGVYAESRCDNNLFQGNVVYNIGEVGMREGSLKTNAAVGNRWINNTVFNCKETGLALVNSQDTVVINNLFVNNGLSQVYVTEKSVSNGGHAFKHNDYFKVGKGEIAAWNGLDTQSPQADKTLAEWSKVSGETTALSVDPQFVNPPTDLHLRPVSPARAIGDQGLDLGAYFSKSPVGQGSSQ